MVLLLSIITSASKDLMRHLGITIPKHLEKILNRSSTYSMYQMMKYIPNSRKGMTLERLLINLPREASREHLVPPQVPASIL